MKELKIMAKEFIKSEHGKNEMAHTVSILERQVSLILKPIELVEYLYPANIVCKNLNCENCKNDLKSKFSNVNGIYN